MRSWWARLVKNREADQTDTARGAGVDDPGSEARERREQFHQCLRERGNVAQLAHALIRLAVLVRGERFVFGDACAVGGTPFETFAATEVAGGESEQRPVEVRGLQHAVCVLRPFGFGENVSLLVRGELVVVEEMGEDAASLLFTQHAVHLRRCSCLRTQR